MAMAKETRLKNRIILKSILSLLWTVFEDQKRAVQNVQLP